MNIRNGLLPLRGFIFVSALLAASLSISPAHAQNGPSSAAAAPDAAPMAPARPVADTYFGVTVTDPYRYIENLQDPQVDAWFKGQDAYTRGVLAKISGRDALLARIKELDHSVPARVSGINKLPGDRYFYEKTMPSEIVAKLYVRDGLSGSERLLLDPDKYPAPPGSHNAIADYAPSWDGKLVGVSVAPGGSEVGIIHIIDVETGKELPDTIDRIRFGSVAWLPGDRAFTYNRLQKLAPGQPETDFEQKSTVYLHVLGSQVDSDIPIFGIGLSPRTDFVPSDLPFVSTSIGAKWALGVVAHGTLNEFTLYEAPVDSLDKPGIPWQKICDVPDDVTGLAIHGDQLYLLSHRGAPHFKVILVDLSHPDLAHAATVIPEGDGVIKNIAAAADGLYIQQTNATVGSLLRLGYGSTKPEEIALPFKGAVSIDSADERIPGLVVTMTSWARAPRAYLYNAVAKTLTDTKLKPLGPYGDPQDVVSEEVMVPSWDGALVPLSIVHKRDLKLDGSNPALIQGYGGYGISIDPDFDPVLLAWIEKGGVYAWAHPRGGGELGEDWHQGGYKLTKPNTWRDFIACADYLVAKKYTSTARFGGMGTSAGGITIGRAITERPDLFSAAIIDVGVSNAERFEFTPNGPPNVVELGSVNNQWGFEDLYAMDAYLHVRDGVHYPAILLTAGWNDPRVAPWQPGKMTARLRAATGSGKPVLLRVDYAGGHGFGSTKEQSEGRLADLWSFLLWQFGETGFQQ
jgi:prolyl oligopeptidase